MTVTVLTLVPEVRRRLWQLEGDEREMKGMLTGAFTTPEHALP